MVEATIYTKENGIEKVVGRPKVLTRIGTEAVFSTTSNSGEELELKLTPTLRKL